LELSIPEKKNASQLQPKILILSTTKKYYVLTLIRKDLLALKTGVTNQKTVNS